MLEISKEAITSIRTNCQFDTSPIVDCKDQMNDMIQKKIDECENQIALNRNYFLAQNNIID